MDRRHRRIRLHLQRFRKSRARIGDGTTLKVAGIGIVHEDALKLSTVFKVSQIHRKLLPISRVCIDGDINEAKFTNDGCQLINDNTIIANGTLRDGLYMINHKQERVHLAVHSKEMLWHHRLAHAPFQKLAQIVKAGIVSGLDKLNLHSTKNEVCPCCCTAKATRALPSSKRISAGETAWQNTSC